MCRNNINILYNLIWFLFKFVVFSAIFPIVGYAESFSASFRDADIKEFINTVSKNINKTIIMDPKVQGLVSVRSYELLDEEKYYQFFLNVLDVYGYTVVEMPNHILKVIPTKRAKGSVVPLQDNAENPQGDELINRVFKLKYLLAKNLAPLLRQLNDN